MNSATATPRTVGKKPCMDTAETGSASIRDISQAEIVVGLLASPGPASELTESLLPEIAGRLPERLPGVRWRLEFVSDRLVEPPTDLSAIISAGRRMLLDRGWHLAVCVTDLPLQTARRPVIAHVSATHGVAVLSMPALGPVSVRKRTAETIVRLIGHMFGDIALAADAGQRRTLAGPVTRRMHELGTRIEHEEYGVGFAARVVTGNIWLLLGMLRAHRPWRLPPRVHRRRLGGRRHRYDHGHHRAVGTQPSSGRARTGHLVQHRHRGNGGHRRHRAVSRSLHRHARRGPAPRAGRSSRRPARPPRWRGGSDQAGLAGHLDRDARRRARCRAGEP